MGRNDMSRRDMDLWNSEASRRPHHLSEATREESRFNRSNTDWGERREDSPRSMRSSDMNGWENRGFDEGRYSAEKHGSTRSDYSGYRPETTGKHFGKGPKGWKRSDERIREEVCEALYRDTEIDASSIEVTVEDGCVCLRGSVEDRDTKRSAERCVENLSGVEDVLNELRIGRQAPMKSTLDNNQASLS